MKRDTLEGIVEKSKTRVECLFCEVCIPKAKKCIEQHTNGAKHKSAIGRVGQQGVRLVDNKISCKLCCKDLEDETIHEHISSAEHSTWLVAVQDLIDGEYLNMQDYFENNSEEIYCEACNCPFKFSLGAIEQHVNWLNHRTNLVEKLKPNNAIFPVEGDQEVWCKICDDYIRNDTASIISHIDDDKEHVEWFVDMEEYIEGDVMKLEKFLSDEFVLTVHCRLCKLEVMCDLFSIENHVQGPLHLRNVLANIKT